MWSFSQIQSLLKKDVPLEEIAKRYPAVLRKEKDK